MVTKSEQVTMSRDQMAAIDMTANIVKAWYDATDVEKHEGIHWYANARAQARGLAEPHWGPGRPRDVATAAAVLAVLSPAISWGQAVEAAFHAYRTGTCEGFTYTRNCDKANLLMRESVRLAGDTTLLPQARAWRIREMIRNTLGGDKVTAFYHCIVASGETDHVCVDRHAMHIALGFRVNDATRSHLLRKVKAFDGYRHVELRYRAATEVINARRAEVGLEPVFAAQVQAGTWVAARNEFEGRRKSSARDATPILVGDVF